MFHSRQLGWILPPLPGLESLPAIGVPVSKEHSEVTTAVQKILQDYKSPSWVWMSCPQKISLLIRRFMSPIKLCWQPSLASSRSSSSENNLAASPLPLSPLLSFSPHRVLPTWLHKKSRYIFFPFLFFLSRLESVQDNGGHNTVVIPSPRAHPSHPNSPTATPLAAPPSTTRRPTSPVVPDHRHPTDAPSHRHPDHTSTLRC
ncbi:hypothetical protein EDB89DRAFT_1440322 [Lactarius sanguifluus]|nr:hypothetical protein EDB89DRAFT_1440322 [Lactarius sanguifluus]